MASAGRILIVPKGNYDSSVSYEMLDLVYHNGTSWLAKKTVKGIEPNAANSEYWHNLINISVETIGALSIDGGTLNGVLKLGGGCGHINATDIFTTLQAEKDSNNYRCIRLKNPTQDSSISESVQLAIMVNGTETVYNLFGEHNIEILKPYIETIIAEHLANN